MIKEEQYNRLERYINQEMNNEEATAFKLEMKEDQQLAEIQKVYNEIPDLLENVSQDRSFRQKVQMVKGDYIKDNQPRKFNFRWIAILIGIIGISFLVWKFAFQNKTINPIPVEEQIYAYLENSEKPTNEIQRNTTNLDESEEQYASAFQLYENKDYNGAILILNKIQAQNKAYINALELKGFSHYQAGQYEASIAVYNTYLKQNEVQKDVVLWYQAFAFLKNNQPNLAKSNLQIIIEQDYPQSEEAEELLKLL